MQKSVINHSKTESASLLPVNKSRESLKNLDGWQSTDDHKMIYREFIFHDFMSAIEMIDRISTIAEDDKHHPDIHLTKYRNLRIVLTTHDVDGLSGKDFSVASKINELPFSKEHQKLQNERQTNKVGLETKTTSRKAKSTDLAAKKNKKINKTRAKKKQSK